MQILDCLGLACPQPVILCRAAVDKGVEHLEVLVDNEPALENVQRFLQGRGYAVSATQEGPQQWRVGAAVDAGAAANAVASVSAAPEARDGQEQDLRTLVLITTETLGRGDETLGTKLMENFLATLPELGSRLWRLVLVNGGVKLTARPGPALVSLQKLAQQGRGGHVQTAAAVKPPEHQCGNAQVAQRVGQDGAGLLRFMHEPGDVE